MFPWLERFKEWVPKRKTIMLVSRCHKEPVECEGTVTKYFVCSKCGRPSDPIQYSESRYKRDHKDDNHEHIG